MSPESGSGGEDGPSKLNGPEVPPRRRTDSPGSTVQGSHHCAVVSVCLTLSGATQALRQITRRTPCMLARGGFELETNLLSALAKLEKTVRVIRNWILY